MHVSDSGQGGKLFPLQLGCKGKSVACSNNAWTRILPLPMANEFAALNREPHISKALGPLPLGTGQEEPHCLSPGPEEKGTSGGSGSAKHSYVAPDIHSKVSCCSSSEYSPSDDYEPMPVPFAPSVPCEAGMVDPSIMPQIPESQEQRNTFQKVIYLMRRMA